MLPFQLRRCSPLILTFSVSVTALGPFLMPWTASVNTNEEVFFDWNSIEASEHLIYHRCYNGTESLTTQFSCARLLVPIDWDTSDSSKISLAVIKLHSEGSSGSSHHEPILFNPGGPGGSGVRELIAYGNMLQEITGGAQTFDLISFDPRGVGNSVNVHCYDNYITEEMYLIVNAVSTDVDAGETAVKEKLARMQGRVGVCKERLQGNLTNLRQHLTTAHSARDMLQIARLDNVARKFQQSERYQQHLKDDSSVKVNYIGVSYGTMLGVTFASMFPQNTGKMVLDGNIDGDAWVSEWPLDFVNDFESIWMVFSERCLAVKERCGLWRPTDKHPQDIMKRVDLAMEKVRNNPIPLPNSLGSVALTYSNLRFIISVVFYQSAALEGVAILLNNILEDRLSFPVYNLPVGLCSSLDDETRFSSEPLTIDAFIATMCGDAQPGLEKATVEDFRHYVDILHDQSPTSGARLAEWRLYCMGWQQQFQGQGRFSGPFGDSKKNIGTPILFLNNRFDPVTPIMNARSMSKKFPGSVVLEQDGVGHCALFSATGSCLKDYVRAYFQNGSLPAANTICPGGCQPFDHCSQSGVWSTQQILKRFSGAGIY